MRDEKGFVLQWEDFDLNVSKIFRDLRGKSEFCDVTLGCSDSNGKLLQGHKVILSSFSEVFKDMLKPHNGKETNNYTSLFLRGISFQDLSYILDFIYQGAVNIAEERLTSFLSAAEDLKIVGIQNDKQYRVIQMKYQMPRDTKNQHALPSSNMTQNYIANQANIVEINSFSTNEVEDISIISDKDLQSLGEIEDSNPKNIVIEDEDYKNVRSSETDKISSPTDTGKYISLLYRRTGHSCLVKRKETNLLIFIFNE